MKNFAAFRREMQNYSPEELMEAEDYGDIGGDEPIYRGGKRFDDGFSGKGGRKMNRPIRKTKRSYLDDI